MYVFLRAEGLALLAAAIAGYILLGGSWWLFFLLILAPDLSMLGYLAGPAAGAVAYNAFHTTIAPLALLTIGLASGAEPASQVAVIWLAHIGLDRALGYGLKYRAGFTETHLGRIGKNRAS